MGKTKETIINNFNDGIVNDPRDKREFSCRVISNFDTITDLYRIIPYRDSVSGDNAPTTSQKQNFTLGLWTVTGNWRVFSLGVKSGDTVAEVLMKDITTGSSNDLDDNTWASPANNQSPSGATDFNLFIYYKKTGKIYGSRSSRYVWEFTPDGSTAWSNSKYDYGSTFSNITQGIIHSKDDIMYFGIDNKIIKNNNGTFSVGLTLPTHFKVTSICEYGNLLAIACSHLSGLKNSVVYLWDRDSSLVSLSESIDWGEGEIKILDVIGGRLVGISQLGNTTYYLDDRVIFSYWDGSNVKIIETLVGSINANIPLQKQIYRKRLNFMLSIDIDGVTREGVWSIGINKDRFNIVHERTPNNDTSLAGGATLKSFFYVGDFLFQSYQETNFNLTKTNHQNSYTAKSIYEKKFNTFGSGFKKNLMGAELTFEPLPTDGQVVLRYKTDANSSWTTIITEGTDNAISKAVSGGASLPKAYKEIDFRIESTGGAIITSLRLKEELRDDNPFT